MSWLFQNYFLPTLNPLTALRSQPTLRPLAPVLKQYKSLVKLTTRDASLRTQYEPAIDRVVRDLERWVAETKVAQVIETARRHQHPLQCTMEKD